ncbi:MAG: MBL fold metallo-hydrolase [Bacilli bacterium]|nr:MBL fold metallo-hydrolase [Bacilli bacterium]
MKVKVLASGSKGNVTYIEDNDTRILIDIGMRCCYVEEKLKEMDVDPKDIDAILLTHIHKDHTLGLHTFARKYNVVAYMTPKMQKELDTDNVKYITKEMTIKGINIKVFRTSHDVESYGYIVQDSLVYITDTGYINNKYFDMLSNKKIYIMESNHDIEMLEEGPYPYHLKQRIWSDKGHLSNEMSSEYLSKFIGDNTKVVVLAHLSEVNNTEEKALEEFKNKNKKDIKVVIGKPKETTELIEV